MCEPGEGLTGASLGRPSPPLTLSGPFGRPAASHAPVAVTPSPNLLAATLALALSAPSAFGQALPTAQPKLLQIYREQVKTGHAAAHVKTEAGWPAAFAKAKSPDYYLALSSMTGPQVAWFISPWDSYTAWGRSMARDEANAELSAELARLAVAGGLGEQAVGHADEDRGAVGELRLEAALQHLLARGEPELPPALRPAYRMAVELPVSGDDEHDDTMDDGEITDGFIMDGKIYYTEKVVDDLRARLADAEDLGNAPAYELSEQRILHLGERRPAPLDRAPLRAGRDGA